jgi:hypothetical protein
MSMVNHKLKGEVGRQEMEMEMIAAQSNAECLGEETSTSRPPPPLTSPAPVASRRPRVHLAITHEPLRLPHHHHTL